MMLFYAWLTYYAAQRHLWFDELLTYYIAKAPSVASEIGELRRMNEIGVDMNPPLAYLATRGSLAVLGDSAYAARFPAIIGFLVGSLCFYRYVERRLTPVYGLLAVMVFWSTPLFRYSTEARAYGLLFGFFGLVILAYDYVCQAERPRWSVPLLALAVAGMAFSHFLAPFYVMAPSLAEIVRGRRRRKIDVSVWAALLIPGAIPFLYLHSMARYQQIAFPPEFQASLVNILRYFSFSLKPESAAWLVAGGLGLIAAARVKPIRARWWALVRPPDVAFVAGLLLAPFAIGAALLYSRGAFFPRYAIPTALAYGILFSFLLAGLADRQRISALVAVSVLALYVAGYNTAGTRTILRAERHPFFASGLRSMPLDDVRPDLPLVAASGLTFLEMDHYSDDATASRLYYLTGGERALRYAHASMFEGMPELRKYFPIRGYVTAYDRFVSEHAHFLVLGTVDYPEDWLLRYLLDSDAQVRLLGSYMGPYKDSQVFEITIRGG